jgi:hypothetical protein
MINPVSRRQRITQGLLVLLTPFMLGALAMQDPTRPPNVSTNPNAAEVGQPLAVTAIFVYPNRRIAIVNGQNVVVGDHVGELTVTSINQDTVELEGPQHTREVLQLVEPVKQRNAIDGF